MESRLAVDGVDAAAGLASLNDWLRREDDLRGRVRPLPSAPGPDDMGSPAEVLAVAVGAGGALTVLSNSLTTWLRQPRRATVSVSVDRPDGTRIKITAEHVRNAQEVEELLRRCLYADEER